jgi:hypothetical protein
MSAGSRFRAPIIPSHWLYAAFLHMDCGGLPPLFLSL